MTARVHVDDDELHVGPRFAVAFQRTLRVPDDGTDHPLPPSFGRLPLVPDPTPASDPAADASVARFLLPLRQAEATWLAFDGEDWHPNAVQVAVGAIDALTGEAFADELRADPQNYVVTPRQLWLDGINSGAGTVSQFVATPLHTGRTVEARLTGRDAVGGIRLRIFEARPGVFPDEAPPRPPTPPGMPLRSADLGIAAGGTIRQRIHPDPHGVDAWDPASATTIEVRLVNTDELRHLTGRDAPPTPIDARTYTEAGFPWFERYDEAYGDLAPADRLTSLTDPHPPDATTDEAPHIVPIPVDPDDGPTGTARG